ncbi:hypothetical protein [Dyadobacter fermentans]|nr:hypothetical protein [Dyadobacter fermentans]
MERLFQHLNLSHVAIALPMLLCSCIEDRTTIIFGRVVDQNQQPVDSIMIVVTGSKSLHAIPLTQTFSGKDGEYQINMDVEKNYVMLNVNIPPYSIGNPKLYTRYKVSKTQKNGQQINTCCFADIGKKTQWDFELGPK